MTQIVWFLQTYKNWRICHLFLLAALPGGKALSHEYASPKCVVTTLLDLINIHVGFIYRLVIPIDALSYLYYSIKMNLEIFKRWISFSASFEGYRPPRTTNKASMDRYFHVDGHELKKSGIPDQPDEKIWFEIFKWLSWPQFWTNFYDFHILCSEY